MTLTQESISSSKSEWENKAACLGSGQLFFKPHRENKYTEARRESAAKAVCANCVVLNECREWAHTNMEAGIWGGETAEERHEQGYSALL